MLRYQQPMYMVPVNSKWRRISDKWLHELEASDKEQYLDWDFYISEYQKNPLAFFLPHGHKRRGKFTNDGQAILSDTRNDLLLITAPNQAGKSAIGAVRMALDLCPCDPEWPIFTQHLVEYKEWTGPKTAVVASYEWPNTYGVWDSAYRKFFPRSELGIYAPEYGTRYNPEYNTGEAFSGERGRGKNFSQGFKRGIEVLHLACGSKIVFLCYHQNLGAWTGRQCDCAHMDEQCPEDLFDELSQRQLTRGDYTPIIMTLTGHLVPGRSDTGAAGWIKRKLIDQGVTKGRKFGQYRIGVEDVPDILMSKTKKHNMRIHWVDEPEALHDEKKMREGRARYFGEWEVGGGIVISAWNPEIHMIEPFDWRKLKPTLYRMIDHGETPCAALIIAVMPWGDAVCIKEYYEYGNSIAKNCRQIVENMCGNKRVRSTAYDFEGQTWPVYEEQFGGAGKGMTFYSSEMDNRSYASNLKESGRTIGQAYNDWGCECSPSGAGHFHNATNTGMVDLLCQWFELDPDRKHINVQLGRKPPPQCKDFGAPRIYLFNDLGNARSEIEGWTRNPKTGKPVDKNDHIISDLRFFVVRDRPYMEGFGYESDDDDGEMTGQGARNEITGY